jgi:hypothetical protein
MKRFYAHLARRNLRIARLKYGTLFNQTLRLSLAALTRQFAFSLELGDALLLDGSWYVTHSGLLRLATRKGCVGIRVVPVSGFCFPSSRDGHFEPPLSKLPTAEASTVMATPIRATCQRWFGERRCESPKHAQ